jgi:hypothetical protein
LEQKPRSANKRKGRSAGRHSAQAALQSSVPLPQSFTLRPLLLEKIPLLAPTALSCIVIFFAQLKGGAVVSLEDIPPGVRIANAFVSYIIYIAKMIWPTNLAVFYPYPGAWPLWQVVGAFFYLAP